MNQSTPASAFSTFSLFSSAARAFLSHSLFLRAVIPLLLSAPALAGNEPPPLTLPAQGLLVSTGASIVNGDVYVWGFRGTGQQGNQIAAVKPDNPPDKVQSISQAIALAGGARHLLALDMRGTVYGWGQSRYGETGCSLSQTAVPCEVIGNIRQIAAGEHFSIALDHAGQVFAWGHNLYGQLGNGNRQNARAPQRIALGGEPARLIGAATEGAFAVTQTPAGRHRVWAWGDNEAGGLGLAGRVYGVQHIIAEPVPVPALDAYADRIVDIGGGNGWGIALLADGDVIGWGALAALGQGVKQTNQSSSEPVLILRDVAQLHTRDTGATALTRQGRLYTWGLAGGSVVRGLHSLLPTLREVPGDQAVVAIGGGKEHILYTTEDGRLHGVGYNDLFKLDRTHCCSPNIDWPGVDIGLP